MNGKINIDLLTIRTLYTDYKPFIIPFFTILSCIIVFLIFILPQANEFFRSQKTVSEEREKLNVLKNNLSVLQTSSDSELDSQVNVLSSALPPNKNFEGVINALSYSANVTGVILGNFDFAVGSLTESPKEIQKFPYLEIELNLTGGIDQASNFLDTLSKTLPMSRVIMLGVTPSGSSVRLAFYYKPFPQAKFNENAKIDPVSKKGQVLIDELEGFSNPSNVLIPLFIGDEQASESAL